MSKTYVPYQGDLPGADEDIVLFDSVAAWGKDAAPHYRAFWVDVSMLASDAAGTQTVSLERSLDQGVTWETVGTPTAIPVGITLVSLFVSPYRNFRVVYANGSDAQSTDFDAELVIDHSSRATP